MEQDVTQKLRELRHLMLHATEEDRHRLPEMSRWFDAYLAHASAAEATELRQAMRRLWPAGVMVLIEEATSVDQEIAAGAKLALEKIRSIREGGIN